MGKVEAFDITTDSMCRAFRPKGEKKNAKWRPNCALTSTAAMHPFMKPFDYFECLKATQRWGGLKSLAGFFGMAFLVGKEAPIMSQSEPAFLRRVFFIRVDLCCFCRSMQLAEVLQWYRRHRWRNRHRA